MRAATFEIRVSIHAVGTQCIVATDETGREIGRLTVPEGYEVRTIPARPRLRAWAWLRLSWWRLRARWGLL